MAFNGKRSERIRIPQQVNADPDLCLAIKERAARNLRPIGAEIVRLLMVGILNDPQISIHEHFLLNAHANSALRKVTHINDQRRSA